ncbi:MAG: DNA primase, partial [Clostridiales bacterium]|nr:DNA primase [Clostridiales bacterium]
MPLPQEFIQELRARNDIESVISSYVNLRRRGRNLVGLCPFHNEKTPSFTVYPENGSFYCFGCGAGGDAINFIRKIENLDYIEAVRFLAARAGLQMPEDRASDETAAIRTRVLEMNRAAGRFFYSVLYSPVGKQALDYLHRRGLSDATIRHFGLGFAPDSWDSLLKHMRQKGFTGEDLRVADLALKGRRESYYDKFRNRVIFPIIDLRGSVIGFGGRVMDDSKPKYLNTADTLVFKKSMNLFAMNFAKNAKAGCLILAEGYMDVISMHQAGFTHAAAKLGTALTMQQAKLLKRYTDEIIIAGDNDEAGQKAVARDIGMLRDAGLSIRVLTVPDGKDPDEYIRENGALKFKHLLDKTGNDIEYRLAKIRSKYSLSQPDGKVAFLKEA